jgi:ABC-type transport system substrate-binding protein
MYLIIKKNASGELDGTGPFQVATRGPRTVMLAAVNDAWQGRPFVDSIEVDGQRDNRVQLLDLSVGRADIIDLSPEFVRQAQQAHLPVITSQPTDLIALVIHRNTMQTPEQREAIAAAVDRESLWSVIFHKQGEPSAALLPNAISGYAFLFPTDRNIARATQLASTVRAPLMLTEQPGDGLMQLAADRLALNLHEAGLNVQVRSTNVNTADIVLTRLHLEAADRRAALHELLQQLGHDTDDGSGDPASLYRVEREFLAGHTAVPLVWLSRSYGVSARVRGLELAPDGTPLLANVSLKAVP